MSDDLQLTVPPKRKPGRPSTGQALSRAQIQRDYRQRNKGNVTKSTVEALDENMALRAQVLQLMNALDDVRMKLRVEFELGEQARVRVRELEHRLAVGSKPVSAKALSKARYELQTLDPERGDDQWTFVGKHFTYTSKASALRYLKFMTSEGDNGWRVLDTKTGKIITS